MKQKSVPVTVIVLVVAVIAAILLGLYTLPSWKKRSENVTGGFQAAQGETDAKGQDPFDGLVRTVYGTAPDMLTADYWIEKDKDRILFSPDEIAEYEQNNPLFVQYYSAEENRVLKLYMYDLPESLDAEIVKQLMDIQTVQQFRTNPNTKYVNGEIPADEYWERILSGCGFDSVPESVVPRYAVCVRRTVAKLVPCDDFASGSPDELFINRFVSAELMPFTGVVILHESQDGEWYYILDGSFCGWVRKDTVAICSGKNEWLSACRPDRFLVVTGSEIVLDDTAVETAAGGMVLPMGTRLKLAADCPEQVNGRSTLGCYVVELPFRASDDTLGWELALIPVSKDVHVGFPVMTSSSVVTQAFKYLGRVYGWGGSLSSNDCSGFIRQVYSCYGFDLPRNALAIARLTDLGSSECSDMTTEKKLRILSQMPPGQLLYMNGHLMLYLGMDEGEPYVISSCATYISPEDASPRIREAYCVFVSNMELLRESGRTWLEDISIFQWKEY